jgi:epoxyqueuosine reductase QueG
VVRYLTDMGYQATAPAEQTYFKYRDYSARIGFYSNWSERHIAYAAGLGTFGLSDGFITEKGISHRCGSVVTNLLLPASPRTAKNMYANCLFYRDGSCRACIKRCPAKAISHKGHDKQKCFQHMQIDLAFLKDKYQLSGTGCALCQTKVPCECGNPVKSS